MSSMCITNVHQYVGLSGCINPTPSHGGKRKIRNNLSLTRILVPVTQCSKDSLVEPTWLTKASWSSYIWNLTVKIVLSVPESQWCQSGHNHRCDRYHTDACLTNDQNDNTLTQMTKYSSNRCIRLNATSTPLDPRCRHITLHKGTHLHFNDEHLLDRSSVVGPSIGHHGHSHSLRPMWQRWGTRNYLFIGLGAQISEI